MVEKGRRKNRPINLKDSFKAYEKSTLFQDHFSIPLCSGVGREPGQNHHFFHMDFLHPWKEVVCLRETDGRFQERQMTGELIMHVVQSATTRVIGIPSD